MKKLRSKAAILGLVAWSFFFLHSSASADSVNVAAASNFMTAMERLAHEFTQQTGHQVVTSYGSTAKLYTQITHGAPFEVFLAADQEHPQRLEREHHAIVGTRIRYAVGKLALWSADKNLVDSDGKVLAQGRFEHLALGNPRVAPYGEAAKQVLQARGLWDALQPKLVFGENLAQTQQFISSGNAELGFIAFAQIPKDGDRKQGSYWLVSQELYTPIVQEAVLLKNGSANPVAEKFLAFLKTPEARAIIESSGYALP